MARIRTIKPEFFTHELVAELEPLCRLFFIGLWTAADREGRLEDRPKRIKAALLPYDMADVDGMLNDLAKHGFIIRYEIEGEKYIQIPKFTKHQRPHPNEVQSMLPAIPTEHQGTPHGAPKTDSASRSTEVSEYGVRSTDNGEMKTTTSRGKPAKPSRASRAKKHPAFNPVPIYCEEYKSQNHSTPTIDGKDAGLLAKLATLYPDPENFRKLCRAYLKDPTQWIVDSGHRVSDFYNRRNAYAQAVRRSQVEQFDAELDEGSDEPLPGKEDPQEAPKLSPPKLSPPKLPRPLQKPASPSRSVTQAGSAEP